MNEPALDVAARTRLAKVLRIMGLFDIMLGTVAILAGPVWLPGTHAYLWWFAGGVMAAAGLGLMVYGRFIQSQLGTENRTVVR